MEARALNLDEQNGFTPLATAGEPIESVERHLQNGALKR